MNAQAKPICDTKPLDLGELGESLGFLLRIAQLQTFEHFFETLGRHGLKPGEFTVLWVIGLNPGLRQGDVARRLRIKPAHMTKLTARLVDRGLIARTPAADDRRAMRLDLTREGHAFVADNRDAFFTHQHDGTATLSHDETENLRALLKKLTGQDDHAFEP